MMSERWVPVAPEDMKLGDTVRRDGWTHTIEVQRVGHVRYQRGEWERLESDTPNLDSAAPIPSPEPETLNLPVPPDGSHWRLMPDDAAHAVFAMLQDITMDQGVIDDAWAFLSEMFDWPADPQPEPAPPATIEAGMWVRYDVGVKPRYLEKFLASGQPMFWTGNSGEWRPWLDLSPDWATEYVPCDPPDNADELYRLLGIEAP